MDLKLLRGGLLDELGRIYHVTEDLRQMVFKTEHVMGLPKLRSILEQMAESEASQLGGIQALFERFKAVVPESAGPAVAGLFEEMRHDLSRQSGVYPPALMEFRLLVGLDKIIHYKLAALRACLMTARRMQAHEVERELAACLDEEIENGRKLAGLADDALGLCCADSQEEIASALAAG